MKLIVLSITHLVCAGLGFALGIYALPILIAPPAPATAQVSAVDARAEYRGRFDPDLPGSDALHWADGEIFLTPDTIAHRGRLAPGPDYRLYLAPQAVASREEFLRIKDQSVQIGPIATFDNFVVPVPAGVEIAKFRSAVVWCESFSQFISAAAYR